ncbi:MAG: hypothetical protein AB8B91_14430 [Rubripirellula sp.]
MNQHFFPELNLPLVVPTRQTLRAGFAAASKTQPAICWLVSTLVLSMFGGMAHAQIYDSLDVHPPRWHMETSDCDARVISQGHLADGGVNNGPCETITFTARHGTEAILLYPIEPVRPMDDLTANLSLMSARVGARIGVRVRYPYLRDPETRRPVSVILYGAGYDTPTEFRTVGIGLIERPLRMKNIALRTEHGPTANLKDPYVDGIVVNAYSGPGTTALRIDELHIDGLIPVSDGNVTANAAPREDDSRLAGQEQSRRVPWRSDLDSTARYPTAFPPGRVVRILEHNGEPLSWVRSLGFDAVLLSKPPDAAILSEAIRSRVMLYAPPPSSPDPALQSLLEPIVAWYIGSGDGLDSRHVEQTVLESKRVRGFPELWQRPLVGAPSESWGRYAPLLDAIVDDLPPRVRDIRGGEEVAAMSESRRRIAGRVQMAVGVFSMAPESLVSQTEAIASSIGAPPPVGFRWHSMWLQTIRSLETTPSAILFRSTRAISSGSATDNTRSMALSYVNRMVAMLAPWIASATPAPPPEVVGAPYRCTRLVTDETDMLLLTSVATRGSEVLAGDGETIDVLLTPADAAKTVWRLTHFSAERLIPKLTPTGARLQIVSPDAAEIVVISSDPAVGGSLSLSANRFGRQAALDRWQLASELVQRTRENWRTASATQASSQQRPSNLISVAERTLADAEPMYRSGDIDATLRMARRADAWALRSEWQLAEALMPDWPRPTSCPPMDMGAAEVQIFWRPLMNDQGWGVNRLTSGSLDEANLIGANRWTFGRRMTTSALSEVMHVQRGTHRGPGALRAQVTPLADDSLPGGYGGTVIQIQSPPVRIAAGKAIRIDAMVQTVGFGGPHQGVLVYDSVGGQESGVLIRGRSGWVPVRLYRQTSSETQVSVMFELIGAGEATIDDVELRLWEPQGDKVRPVLTPIAEKESDESTRR